MSSSPARPPHRRPRGISRRTAAIATACSGGFLAFLDTTIVNTAFPDIAASFTTATPKQLSWVLDTYFIVIAALLVPAGGIADRVGRKRVFLAGVGIFTLASLACAAAPGWEALVAARALQGVGAAVVMAVSLALILPEYPLANRAAAVSLWGASAALAAASGPPLGGLLVETDWRIVFLVNLPLGALVYATGRRALTESSDAHVTGLPDLLGAALAALGLGALALAILEGSSWGWASAESVTAFAMATVALALTALRCLSHPRPVVDPELLRIESFARANLGILLLGMAFFSTILANVLFLTGVWQYSLLRAGLAVVPGAIATAIAAIPAGKLADRHGHRAAIVPGCLLYVAGMAIVRGAGPEPAFLTTWLPAMALNGAGLGMAFPALAAAALKNVPAERFGSASAVSSAARQFGGVLGTAILFAVGAPVTLAAADDVYLVSTLWALGAAVVATTLGGRVLSVSLGAVVVTGALILAAPAAAAITKTSITTPTDPAYRLYEAEEEKTAPTSLRVAGVTDGTAGDLIDLLCTRGATFDVVRTDLPVGMDGGFDVPIAFDDLKPSACVLRAVPYKLRPKDFGPFAGPLLSVTAFDPRFELTRALGSEGTIVRNYVLESGHRRGRVALQSASGGLSLLGVHADTLDPFGRPTWSTGAALTRKVLEPGRPSLTVDGRVAYVAGTAPLVEEEGRPVAPKGFDGLHVTASVDERTGAVAVQESERVLRCEKAECVGTGVALQRTLTLTEEHTRAEVEDRWVSADGGAHHVRVVYIQLAGGADAARWRFGGEPSLHTYKPGRRVTPRGPGSVLTHDGTLQQQLGTLTYDPAPEAFTFVERQAMTDTVALTVPAGGSAAARRTFALGDASIQADPEPTVVPVGTPAPTHQGQQRVKRR